MAVSYLVHHFGRDFLELPVPFVRSLDRSKADLALRMMERGVNSPLTSSCGRLYDAVAALIGLRSEVNYEAQAAIELEMAIEDSGDECAYPIDLIRNGENWIIDTKPLFVSIVKDLERKSSNAAISQRFHSGLVTAFANVASLIRERTSLHRVCLSGGTFHNAYLLSHLQKQLERRGFRVFSHSEVPAGDGGLSLGQALIAHHRVLRTESLI
jgi:hydrogenase maturation protein HypF